MIKELFQPDLLLIMQNGNIKDYSDYFSALYDRQESFDKPFVDSKYYGLYSPDRHSGSMKTRSFPMNGASWVEFQLWLDAAFTLSKPVRFGNTGLCAGSISHADAGIFLAAAGIYKRPISTGNTCTGEVALGIMVASNGTVLASGLTSDLSWETAYNTLLIPYERSINSSISKSLRYIKNLAQYGDLPHFFRTSTLKFDGTGT
jgi:hypothetical protein